MGEKQVCCRAADLLTAMAALCHVQASVWLPKDRMAA